MSFKPGRAFGDQVASSFDRRRNWFARRKWERKEEIKRPPRFRSHRKAAVPWRNSFLALYFSSLHLVNVRPPWGQFHPAAFWKQVVILPVWRDAIRVSWSDVCPPPQLIALPSFQLVPLSHAPWLTHIDQQEHIHCGAHALRQSEKAHGPFPEGLLVVRGGGVVRREDGLMQLLQAMQGSKENTAGDRERRWGARLCMLTSWAEIQLDIQRSLCLFTWTSYFLLPYLSFPVCKTGAMIAPSRDCRED